MLFAVRGGAVERGPVPVTAREVAPLVLKGELSLEAQVAASGAAKLHTPLSKLAVDNALAAP